MWDNHQFLPTCVYLQGEYGIDNLYVGVPAKLGAQGLEQVIELDLSPEEKAGVQHSASAVRELVEVLHRPKE